MRPLSLCCVVLLGGCGGTSDSSTTTARSAPEQTPAATTSAQATTKPASATPPAPPSAQAAAAVVLAHDYTPEDLGQYHPNQMLRVLVGRLTGTADGYRKKAFFFAGSRYLGTDVKKPSATIAVVSQSSAAVTIAYQLYRAPDTLENYSNGTSKVTFVLHHGHLSHHGWIPPEYSLHGLSRF